MHAGLVRIGQWVVGVGLATAIVMAHAQRLSVPLGGFPHATMSRAIYGGGGRFDGLHGYAGGVTAVSDEARPMQRRPAESPVRAGSIREDVARYNEERAAFRPYGHGNADGPRPPMPSPYRN